MIYMKYCLVMQIILIICVTLKLANVPTEPKLPQTGDNANPLLYLGIGALALITGVGVGLRGRKKKNKQ